MIVVKNEDDDDVSTLQTEEAVSSGDIGPIGDIGSKRWRKYVRYKNIEQFIEKQKKIEREAEFNAVLKDAFKIFDYASNIKKKTAQNKNCIKRQIARNPDFVRPMAMQSIANKINKK